MKTPKLSASRTETRVFLSYSRKDSLRVGQLREQLEAEESIRVFLDTADILPSEEWKPRLESLIRSADVVVFVVSSHSIASEVCTWELMCAEQMNKRIVPLVLQNLTSEVPPVISKLNYVFATDNDDQVESLTLLKRAIGVDIVWLRGHTRLGELADRWEKTVKLGAQPLSGRELESAELWLARQPRNAPDPTPVHREFIYESRRLASRQQKRLLAGAFVTIGIVGLLSVFAWVQRTAALEGERKAEEALRTASEAARTMTSKLAGELQGSLMPQELVRSILQKSVGLQESLAANFPDDQPLQVTQMVSQILVGKVLERQNDHEAAISAYTAALAWSDRLAASGESSTNVKSYEPLILNHIGSQKLLRGELTEAYEYFQQATEIYRRIMTTVGPQPMMLSRMAESLTYLAKTAFELAQVPEAEVHLEEAVSIYRVLIDDPDASFLR